VFSAQADERAAALREQAALQHEKTVSSQTTTSRESGPSIAARAVQAQYAALKAQREATGSGLKYTAEQVQQQTDQEDAFRDATAAIKKAGGVPPQFARQMQLWGGAIKDWGSAFSNIMADNTMTQEQKNAAVATMRLINVKLNHDSGRQVTPEEAPRLMSGYGVGPAATANDVMAGLRTIGGNLTRERTRMVTADPGLGMVFAAGDNAVASGPDRPYPGSVVGK
jgi:hypothetical protein